MPRTIRVRIRKGRVVEPVEPGDLPEEVEGWLTVPEPTTGPEEVEEIVVPDPTPETIEAFHRSAGSWRDLLPEDFLDTLRERRATPRQPLEL
jgi:hypothetical protein